VEEKKSKRCFVIAPIGDEGSEVRKRSDLVLRHIFKPVAEECGYKVVRADELSEPGNITVQVIQHLIEDDLVIADLTGRNPNVFYELAVRHILKKPIVQIIKSGESIPFDVASMRTIFVDHHDLDDVATCKEELIRQIRSVEKDPTKVNTPISLVIDLQPLRQSGNPLERSTTEIISMLQDMRSMISNQMGYGVLYDELQKIDEKETELRNTLKQVFKSFNDINSNLELAMEKKENRGDIEDARLELYSSMLELASMSLKIGGSLDLMDDIDNLISQKPKKV
jgi:hypothetical protein